MDPETAAFLRLLGVKEKIATIALHTIMGHCQTPEEKTAEKEDEIWALEVLGGCDSQKAVFKKTLGVWSLQVPGGGVPLSLIFPQDKNKIKKIDRIAGERRSCPASCASKVSWEMQLRAVDSRPAIGQVTSIIT